MIPVGVAVFAVVQRQVLDQRLAPDPLPGLPRPADRLVRFFARGMHDINRHTRHVGNHDGTIGRLALDLRGPGKGVGFGAGIALGHQLALEFGDDIAVFGMDQSGAAQFAKAAERREHLVIIHHQGALVGHEMLEGGNTLVDHQRHVVEHLLPPPGHRHMVGIVTGRPAGFVVPHLHGIQQALPLPRQHKVHNHRGAARQGRPGAGFKVIRRIGAHEGHFQMGMRVNATGHDVTAGGIQRGVAPQVRADLHDLVAIHQHIGGIGQVMGNDGAVADGDSHAGSP